MKSITPGALIKRLWNYLRGLLAVVIILLGVVVGLISLILPFESLYQTRLENFLSQQWNTSVKIGTMSGQWKGSGPLFSLKNLSLQGQQQLNIQTASLSINLYRLLLPGGDDGINLSINQADALVIRSESSGAVTATDAAGADYSETLEQVLGSGRLQIENLRLSLFNEQKEKLLDKLQTSFLVEQNDQRRGLQLVIKEKNLGKRIELRAITQQEQRISEQAQWYLLLEELSLAQLGTLLEKQALPHLMIDGTGWFDTEDGIIQKSQGSLRIVGNEATPVEVTSNVDFVHEGAEKNWQLGAEVSALEIDGVSLDDMRFDINRQGDQLLLSVEQLTIGQLQALLKLVPNDLNTDVVQELSGSLNNLSVIYDLGTQTIQKALMNFSDISFKTEAASVSGLSGEAIYRNDQIALMIDSDGGQLAIPSVMRGESQWQRLLAQLDIPVDDFPNQIQLNSLWCDCIDFEAFAQASWRIDQVKQLNLIGDINQVDISKLYKYWPHRVWKDNTIRWLDRGLEGGVVEQGSLFYFGEVGNKALSRKKARFHAHAHIEDADVLYHPDWPRVKQLDAHADFINQSMYVDVTSADLLGNRIDQAEVSIAHFKSGAISADAVVSGDEKALIDFMKQSPILKKLKTEKGFDIHGPYQADLQLVIPYRSDQGIELRHEGLISFLGAEFNNEDFQLTNIHGAAHLSTDYLDLAGLVGNFLEFPVTLGGGIRLYDDRKPDIDVQLDGLFDVEKLQENHAINLPLQGESQWQFSIKSTDDALLVQAESDLKGVISQMPMPLEKAADVEKPVKISCLLPCENTMLNIVYDDVLNAEVYSTENDTRIRSLIFGNIPGQTPPVEFGGRLKRVNIDQWLSFLSKDSVNKTRASDDPLQLPSERIELRVEELIFMSRVFKDLTLVFQQLPTGILLEVDGQAVAGDIEISNDLDARGVLVDLRRLHWSDVVSEYLSQSESDDFRVPDLHIWIDDFRYEDIPLGSLRMESRQVADGMKIEQLNTASDLLNISITGTWSAASGQRGLSDFEIVMISENIAAFMQSIGLSAPISGAQTIITMDVSWEGLPSQFDLSNMYGDLDVKIGSGEVVDSKPGIGRVLGLFSLTSLPRRLLLDFRDVFAEGLRFESMEGAFKLSEGRAVTDGFFIAASSAEITITGSTGFVEQNYDQLITVKPEVGKTFPTIGAIAGGAVGAAAGFVVQGIFDRALKNTTEIRYKVTGTWLEPEIELLDEKK
ncbi:YhdP family protein [Marinicella sp. W31]|uniref:YhdP family protein n=1 Tax=Marinicella sp. W31 TaxID=3023713 RepID=UPI003757C131